MNASYSASDSRSIQRPAVRLGCGRQAGAALRLVGEIGMRLDQRQMLVAAGVVDRRAIATKSGRSCKGPLCAACAAIQGECSKSGDRGGEIGFAGVVQIGEGFSASRSTLSDLVRIRRKMRQGGRANVARSRAVSASRLSRCSPM